MNSQSPTLFSRLMQFRWQLLALGFILFAIFKTNGGLLALRGLGRILFPMLLFYIVLKFVQSKVKQKFGGVFTKVFEAQQNAARQAGGNGGPFSGVRSGNASTGAATLVECPKCGVYAVSGHVCQK